MRSDQHVAQGDKVAVLHVLNCLVGIEIERERWKQITITLRNRKKSWRYKWMYRVPIVHINGAHKRGKNLIAYLQQHPRDNADRVSYGRQLQWPYWSRQRRTVLGREGPVATCAALHRPHRETRRSWSCAEQFHWVPRIRNEMAKLYI